MEESKEFKAAYSVFLLSFFYFLLHCVFYVNWKTP